MSLQALVDQWCAENGRPLFGPEPRHRCGPGCTHLGSWPHQVCATSRLEHHCPQNDTCEYLVETVEGSVCSFSGRVLTGPSESTPSHGDPHWGHSSRRRVVRRPRSMPLAGEISEAVFHFLGSSARRRVHEAEKARFLSVCSRAGRSASSSRATFQSAAATCLELLRPRRASLSPPSERAPWMNTLARAILAWWTSLVDCVPEVGRRGSILHPSALNVLPMVGAVLQFLGSPAGLVLDGVVLIAPSARVQRHVPTQRQMGQFERVSCRKLSVCTRTLRSALLLPSGRVRVVPQLLF